MSNISIQVFFTKASVYLYWFGATWPVELRSGQGSRRLAFHATAADNFRLPAKEREIQSKVSIVVI
jgi:hypothetical protein